MNLKKRLISVAVIIAALIVVIAAVCLMHNGQGKISLSKLSQKETINIWYTDDAITDYLASKALEFNDTTGIRVETKLVSGLEYLEEINKASIAGEDFPDLYIISNDSLEKAYLAGLAAPVADSSQNLFQNGFSQTARDAVSYHGKYIGYPMYFETSALLYNKTYLAQIAQEAELSGEEQLIPGTIADILNFADQYTAPENVEYIFRWDVSDIFYNYFFIGNYITVGGQAGDDKTQIDIYNSDAIASLKVYQELNQFFSIEPKESNYDSIMQEFIEGKTIYTIATSDCMKKIEDAKKEGSFPYEYGIASLPDINQDMKTKGMSVTNAVVINGYSVHKNAANEFAAYITGDESADLYDMTGKISAGVNAQKQNEYVAAFGQNYSESVPIPKLLETSNFWVGLEICFSKVWDGEDANEQIRTLSEQIKTQLEGITVEETLLEDPKVELLPDDEYEDTGIGE